MTKIKVNIEKPDPDTQTIHKHKDFNQFISTYHQMHTPAGFYKLWQKDRKKVVFIIIVICLVLIWVLAD